MESLGIDIKVMIAQVVNFGILFFVLSKVLYKPLIKILDERSANIKKSLENSEKIDQELTKIQEKQNSLLEKAKSQAAEDRAELIKLAKNEKEKIISDAKQQAARQVQKGLDQIRSEELAMQERIRKDFMDEAVDNLAKKLAKSKNKFPLLESVLK